MRERVEQGRTGFERGGERRPGSVGGPVDARRSRVGGPPGGPRPVRPARALVLVRPVEVPRPVRRPLPDAGGRPARVGHGVVTSRGPVRPRVLAAPRRSPGRECSRLWRAVSGIAVVAASAAVVVALGLLVRVAEPAPVPAQAPAPVVVTAAPGETVWDVAARVAPGRPGPEVAAVAERIVVANDLRSVRLGPGQVLRVAGG